MDDYSYRLLSRKDIAEISKLFKDTFNVNPKNDFIDWKYFNNPFGHALLAGAFFNGKLVGSGAMIPEKMNVFESEEMVFKFTDLMTHPNHQRKGLSKNINKLLGEEVMKIKTSFSYTLCSKVSTKSFIRNNWVFLDGVINFFKPWIVLKIYSLLKNNNFQNLKLYDTISNHLDGYKFKIDISRIGIHKTPDYIKWRTSNPNFTYRLICSYDRYYKINGYLIYSISANNLLNVIDLESNCNDLTIESNLLYYAEFIAVKEKYRGILVLTIKNSPFYHFVKNNNYLRNPFDKGPLKTILDFDIYLYDKSLTTVTNLKLWNINGMNYDDI